ncbi:MAG TPA: DNA translocase FtsK 4TM domain-containing protein [Azospirillaceae bacterium]|nr:DNA translocase FtsK 4TM domain-containing protein [Azospirillaceae bacterium]
MTTRLAAKRPDAGRPEGGRPGPRGAAPPAGGRSAGKPRGGRNSLLPEGSSEFLAKRAKEMGGLAVVGAAAALGACLFSYDPGDPSWNTAVPDGVAPVTNLLGTPGAYVADVLVQTLGLSAWLMAVVVAGWGLRVMRHAAPRRWTWRILAALAAVTVTP